MVRKARGLTQETFDMVSSRVYVSSLERGVKQPTLRKIDELAAHLDVHPLTLLVLAYCRKPMGNDASLICESVQMELDALWPVRAREPKSARDLLPAPWGRDD
jgi:transcriptional regulator with XRE-family HTH domain